VVGAQVEGVGVSWAGSLRLVQEFDNSAVSILEALRAS